MSTVAFGGGVGIGAVSEEIVIRVRPGVTTTRAQEVLQSALAVRRWGGEVGVRPALDEPARDAALAARVGLDRYYIVVLPAGLSALDAIGVFGGLAETVEAAEEQGRAVLHSDDPLFPQQWHLDNSGQNGGTPGADMRGAPAWYVFDELQPITLAILDTGVSLSHPDLVGVLVPGRNTFNNNTNTDDDVQFSHGTYCAGIAAAVYNNAVGVAGIAPNARIMPVKVMTPTLATQTTVGNGVKWAADNGAKIASMSLSFPAGSSVSFLQSSVQYAAAAGMVLVSSTGNTPGVAIGYPAAWPEVIAVGATDNKDLPWSSQTTGPEIDLVAPGVDILTTVDQNGTVNGYGVQSGTSMACPMVAATAAMVWGVNPALTAAEVRAIVEDTTDDLGGPGWDSGYGKGRLNAAHAVGRAVGTLPCTVDLNGDGIVNTGDLYMFLAAYFAKQPSADYDHSGAVNSGDLFAFLNAWFAGCGI